VKTSSGLALKDALSSAFGAWRAGRAAEAAELCRRVLAACPGQIDALHLLGVLTNERGDLDAAIGYLREACASPDAPAAFHSNLAELYRRRRLLEDGERAARRAVTLDPSYGPAWNNLGILLQEAGKLPEALAALRRAAELSPNSAELHNNIGNTLDLMGELSCARVHYERALSLDPGSAEAHCNLGKLLNELGEAAASRAELERALHLNPRLPDVYLNLASLAAAAARFDEALRWLDLLASFAPENTRGLTGRAGLLLKMDRAEEALEPACRAVALAPQSAQAHAMLGQVRQALGDHEGAAASLDEALRLAGTATPPLLVQKADLLSELGRFEEARALLDEALTADPAAAGPWLSLVELKKFTPGDPDLERMEQLLERTVIAADRMILHFALGKAWLDAGDADRAFAHLHEGNRAKRATFTFDLEAALRWLREIATVFDAPRLRALGGGGDPSELPIFVIGMPRSGTSLIEQILASHPQVAGGGELLFFERSLEELRADRHLSAGYPACLALLDRDDLHSIGQRYLAKVAPRARGRRHLVDKLPANFPYAGLIHAALPNARIVHCRRDPVDTCLSCYTKLFAGWQPFVYDLTELGRFYRAYRELMEHWATLLPPDRYIEVDYESVVDDLEAQARRLVAFCGLEWDDACLAFHRTARQVRTASATQVRRPIYRSSVGRWKPYAEHLTPLLTALGEGLVAGDG
jgi:tetratricopeptide (TPR) repeat protein